MLDDKTIQPAVARLLAPATSPSHVILFGSYARGMANEGSDVNRLVIERDISSKAEGYMGLRDALGRLAAGVGVDLLVYRNTRTLSGASGPMLKSAFSSHTATTSSSCRRIWSGIVLRLTGGSCVRFCLAIPQDQVHAIPAELGASAAALAYAETLRGVVDFDLVLLGLGEDGHTASLFPGRDWGVAASAPDALAVFDAPKPPAQRVSPSAARLSRTREVLFSPAT